MFHPNILAALARERRNTMLAEAAAARLASQAGETRRHRRVPDSPEVLEHLEYEIALVASEELDRDRGALSPR